MLMEIHGEFYQAGSSASQQATLKISGIRVSVWAQSKCLARELSIETVQNGREIYMDSGELFSVDTKLPNAILRQMGSKDVSFQWLRQITPKRVAILSVLLITGLFALRIGFYTAVDAATHSFPANWEREIGRRAYASMKEKVFQASQLSDKRQNSLAKTIRKMAETSAINPPEIKFHRSDTFKVNALAFPGGPILFTDGLVDLLETDDLVLAVAAHEIAHIEKRHSLHRIFETIGLVTLVTIFFGSGEAIIEELAIVGIGLKAFKSSRESEREADLRALEILQKAGMPKRNMLLAMQKLSSSQCPPERPQCAAEDQFDWFSTHPTDAERLKYLRELSGEQ
ncbi:MAG: M48 family metallopeptidase [Candidatus Eutrophobiaceae bacterium]